MKVCLQNNTLKLVHGAYSDLKLLSYFFDCKMDHFIDLSQAFKLLENSNQSIGLATLSKNYLNFELDKSLQCSTWNMRPLANILLKYAALDALIMLPIFQEFLKMRSDEEFLMECFKKSEEMYKKVKFDFKVDQISLLN